MPRWTGTWLSGPEVTLGELRNPDTWPGARLGLPREGTGSVATFSARAFAFAVDLVVAGLASGLINAFVHDPTGAQRQAAAYGFLALEHVLLVALTGQTLGMRLLGLRVVRPAEPAPVPGLVTALLRTLPLVLTAGLVAFFSRDGRGLHDVLAGSVVVRD
ncbi:MAG TPA: RDD family protein [Mycobacteriales bacterium]|nr:RDD family protein [Mycobacteriales bacterium]